MCFLWCVCENVWIKVVNMDSLAWKLFHKHYKLSFILFGCPHSTCAVLLTEPKMLCQALQEKSWWCLEVLILINLSFLLSVNSSCGTNNGGCEHFCLPDPVTNFTCECMTGYTTDPSDETKCVEGRQTLFIQHSLSSSCLLSCCLGWTNQLIHGLVSDSFCCVTCSPASCLRCSQWENLSHPPPQKKKMPRGSQL